MNMINGGINGHINNINYEDLLSINMYDKFPDNCNIKLSKLFDIVYSKIKILGDIEDLLENFKLHITNRNNGNNSNFKLYDKIFEKLSGDIEIYGTENEYITFWICLMAYQKKLDWYINLEKLIFKSRLLKYKSIHNNLYFNILKKKFGNDCFIKDNSYLKVGFEHGLELLSKYDVKLIKGFVYIPENNFEDLIMNLFERNLRRKYRRIKDNIKVALENDTRIKKLVDIIPEVSTYKSDFQKLKHDITDKIKKTDIPMLAAKCFPLCMDEMYKSLKKDHRLKHFGRIQFGSFLKGINMDHNDCKDFFMEEFLKLGDKNIKEYSYYIDHIYGLQGKKTNYSPWGCDSIANKQTPKSNEVFGCPFKYYSDNNLKFILLNRVNQIDAQDILNERKDSGYSMACKKLFYKLHPQAQERKGIGKHPNSYFASSFYFLKKKNTKEEKVTINNLQEEVKEGLQTGGIDEEEYKKLDN